MTSDEIEIPPLPESDSVELSNKEFALLANINELASRFQLRPQDFSACVGRDQPVELEIPELEDMLERDSDIITHYPDLAERIRKFADFIGEPHPEHPMRVIIGQSVHDALDRLDERLARAPKPRQLER